MIMATSPLLRRPRAVARSSVVVQRARRYVGVRSAVVAPAGMTRRAGGGDDNKRGPARNGAGGSKGMNTLRPAAAPGILAVIASAHATRAGEGAVASVPPRGC